MQLEKYVFRIRTRNGVLLEHLQIQAVDEDEARAKLSRMYPHCEILVASQEAPGANGSAGPSKSFEDIADLLNH
jgi:hypothetical protein